MDGDAVITLAAIRGWPKNEDARFFRRDVDTVARFEHPVTSWRGGEKTGTNSFSMPWVKFDGNGHRLLQFSYFHPPYDWTDDPRRGQQEHLLADLAADNVSVIVDWSTRQLWQVMFAVARADRFNEGVFASNARALTIIANEIRERFLAARVRELQGGQTAWIIGK